MRRTRECLTCKHKWVSPVVYSSHTQMLTGEITPDCPLCDSRSIMSSPIHEFVIMENAAKTVQNSLRHFVANPEVNFLGGSEDGYDFKIKFGDIPGVLEFRIAEESRMVEVKTIAGGHMEARKDWFAYAEVMQPGGYWDPPYSDEVEVAQGGSPENVLIEALLVYFRNTMYDSMPYIEYTHDESDEDIPQ